MPYTPTKPRYRADRDIWITQIDGKQYRLAKGKENEKEAKAKFHALMAAKGKVGHVGPSLTVHALFDIFLAHHEIESAPDTHRFYRSYLQSFTAKYGTLKAEDIRPLHVTQWTQEHRRAIPEAERKKDWRRRAWSDSTTRGALTAVKAAFRWAVEQGYTAEDILAKVRKPAMEARRVLLTTEQIRAIYEATPDQEFRDVLDALYESGARPGEIRRIEAQHCDFENRMVVLPPRLHKTGKRSGKPRILPMTPKFEGICRRLAAKWPTGPIFRNTEYRPWTRVSLQRRIQDLRGKLNLPVWGGIGSIRHIFTDDALEAEVPIKTVAEILGHQSTAMIDRHYSRLRERKAYMQSALAKFRPSPKPDPAPNGEGEA